MGWPRGLRKAACLAWGPTLRGNVYLHVQHHVWLSGQNTDVYPDMGIELCKREAATVIESMKLFSASNVHGITPSQLTSVYTDSTT